MPYGEMSVATPIVACDKVFLAPFHGGTTAAKSVRVIQSDGGPPRVVWKNDEVQGLCLSGVLWQGHLYVPDRDDLSLAGESGTKMNLKCIDFNTGEVKWTQRPMALAEPDHGRWKAADPDARWRTDPGCGFSRRLSGAWGAAKGWAAAAGRSRHWPAAFSTAVTTRASWRRFS